MHVEQLYDVFSRPSSREKHDKRLRGLHYLGATLTFFISSADNDATEGKETLAIAECRTSSGNILRGWCVRACVGVQEAARFGGAAAWTMADPTIQTFCCHHNNRTDIALVIMNEFNSDAYNTVCMVSSSIGILGAIYQVIATALDYLFFFQRCSSFVWGFAFCCCLLVITVSV